MSCCVDRNIFIHDSENLAEALGISEEERLKAMGIVEEALSLEKVSKMVELIWSDKCEGLSIQAKVHATLKLGMDLQNYIREHAIGGGERRRKIICSKGSKV